MNPAEATRSLLDGLERATRAFEAGDAIAGSAALDAVVAACATLEVAGVQLDPATLERSSALHRACAGAALAAGRAIAEELQGAGVARRAMGAYGPGSLRAG